MQRVRRSSGLSDEADQTEACLLWRESLLAQSHSAIRAHSRANRNAAESRREALSIEDGVRPGGVRPDLRNARRDPQYLPVVRAVVESQSGRRLGDSTGRAENGLLLLRSEGHGLWQR